jgi:hypothetical protein
VHEWRETLQIAERAKQAALQQQSSRSEREHSAWLRLPITEKSRHRQEQFFYQKIINFVKQSIALPAR